MSNQPTSSPQTDQPCGSDSPLPGSDRNEGGSAGDRDVRSRLIVAAGPVFAQQGFDGATIREICADADANVAAIGYYFGDKLGLYREVIRSIRDARERRFPTPSGDEVDPRIALYRLVHTMLSRMLTAEPTGWESQLLMREMQRPTPIFESIVDEFFRPLYRSLTGVIARLLGDDSAGHLIDQLALSVVGQCVYYRCGGGVVEVLISASDRRAHFDIDSLSMHITAVTLAATKDSALTSRKAELASLLKLPTDHLN